MFSSFFLAASADAATYYVAKTGKDTNICTQAQTQSTPKLTIKSGIICLKVGDTLIIKAGIYGEGVVAAPTGGTATNRITAKANPGETVVITHAGTAIDCLMCFTQVAQSYVTVEGVILAAADVTTYGIWIRNANHITLETLK